MNESTQTPPGHVAQHSSHVREGIMGALTIMGICLIGVIVCVLVGVGVGLMLGVL